jgi:hypothetical protein
MKIQAGKLVVKDGMAACECCGGDPDWLDNLDPPFPVPDGPGSGPQPGPDIVCCNCDPESNLTRCTNCWNFVTDVVFDGGSFNLVVDRRVRVALRFVASLRLFAEAFNSSGVLLDTYDVVLPINIILDSYPGDGDEYCGAEVEEVVEGDGIINIGGREFAYLYTINLNYNTQLGFVLSGEFQIGLTTGGSNFYTPGPSHSLSVLGISGTTITNGIRIQAGQTEATKEYTIPMGTCETRNAQDLGGLYVESVQQESGLGFQRTITDLTNLSIDMVVGNVFPCS